MAQLSFCSRCNGIRNECGCNHRKFEATKTTTERGYGGDWIKLSRLYRSENPFCEVCLGKGKFTGVEEVHHKVPIKDDPSQRLYWPNLMSVCRICHREIESQTGGGDQPGAPQRL